jgi:3-isopropylmalate/(R)-2-methylmalate dehydratase large subunit
MPMTMAEKMLARASGRESVRPGEVISPDPELVILHDGYVETAHKMLTDIGYRRITNPERVMIIVDHQVISTSPRAIEQARNNRRIAAEWQIGYFFDAGRAGQGHIYPMEVGLVRPGMFLFAYDMHCSNFGAIGAFALRAGPDVPAVLATGTSWTVVPQTLRVNLRGGFAPGVHPRDLGFLLSADLTSGRAGVEFDYRVVEFGGEAVTNMPLASRVALCNTLTEIGVINVLFPPMSPLGTAADANWVESDADAKFENVLDIDLATVQPQVALPGGPDRAASIDTVVGKRIDHAYLGACGSSMYDDFRIAADILKGQKVAPNVRLFVVPSTVALAKRLSDEGLTQQFMDAGAIILPPGCGPCAGGVGGPMGPGEVSISTAATNGPGRMGARDSECYLGSPRTVIASAVRGEITDPRKISAEMA